VEPEKIVGLFAIGILLYSVISLTHTNTKAEPLGIKITSPAKGQRIPIDNHNLTVTGISTYNTSMNCQVSILMNDMKPYKQAIAKGENGTMDYSTWKYIFTSKDFLIKEGDNRLTAKLSCRDNLSKFYSVNLTGYSNTNTLKQQKLASDKTPLIKGANATKTRPVNPVSSNSTSPILKTGEPPNEKLHNKKPTMTTNTTANTAPQANASHSNEVLIPKAPLQKQARAQPQLSTNITTPTSTSTPTNTTANTAPQANASHSEVLIPKAPLQKQAQAQRQRGVNDIPFPLFPAQPTSSDSNNLTVPSATSDKMIRESALSNTSHTLSTGLSPSVYAGSDQKVTAGSSVTLNGSATRANSGIIFSYLWKQSNSSPLVILSDVTRPISHFTAPSVSADTVLTFELIVTDNLGQVATDRVNVLVQPISVETNLIKPNSNSSQVVKIPSNNTGSGDAGNNNDNTTASNVPPLTPQLSNLSSESHPPVAKAGSDQVVDENSTVILDGSRSYDIDSNSILRYSWAQTAGSPTIALANANTPTLVFTAPNVSGDTTFSFDMTVTDNEGESDTSTVNLTVKDAPHPVPPAG
jgi:K319L-like, PKD domain